MIGCRVISYKVKLIPASRAMLRGGRAGSTKVTADAGTEPTKEKKGRRSITLTFAAPRCIALSKVSMRHLSRNALKFSAVSLTNFPVVNLIIGFLKIISRVESKLSWYHLYRMLL